MYHSGLFHWEFYGVLKGCLFLDEGVLLGGFQYGNKSSLKRNNDEN